MATNYNTRRQRAAGVRSSVGSGLRTAGSFLGGFFTSGPKTLLDALQSERTVRGQQQRALYGKPQLNQPAPQSPLVGLPPEAQAIRTQRLNAQKAAQPTTIQPVNQSAAPQQQITSGFRETIQPLAPMAPLASTPTNPATAQLQQEANDLAKYGTAIAPAQEQDTFDYQGSVYRTNPDGSATLVSGNGPQTLSKQQALTPEAPTPEPQVLEGEVMPPSPKFIDTYRNIYDSLGLGDIRSQIESTGVQLQELQDKKVDEISQINENPWLTEGQRQDRTNAINKKYEQKEANLMNRIQLFQSTFEQGRQEAQFVASQTAQEQQFETTRMDARLEAERKLKEAGQEILSVEDARALGVPYGTTVAEARELGVVPDVSEADLPALAQEYEYAKSQGYGGSFTDYINVKKDGGTAGGFMGEYFPGVNPSVDAWLKNIRSGTAKFDDVPKDLKDAVSIALASSGQMDSRVGEIQSTIGLIDEILANPALGTITGLSGILDPRVYVPGTQAQYVKAQINQLKAFLALENRQKLKGQGTISDREFKVLTEAATALDAKLSDEDTLTEINKLRSALETRRNELVGSSFEGGDDLDRALDEAGFRGDPGKSVKGLQVLKIGGRNVTVSPTIGSRLSRAAEDFRRATGKELIINQSFRTHEEQARLYRDLSKKGARVAPPGKSFHEKGLAIDVTNWKEAEPFLRRYGFRNDLKDDKGHFSVGEFS